MNGIRAILVEQSHDLFDSHQQLQNGGAPTESDDVFYRYPINTPVEEIRSFYKNVVSSIMGADLVSIELLYMEDEDTVLQEVVEDRHEDGTLVTIEDLATLAVPDWQAIHHYELTMSFNYVIGDAAVLAD